jgi:hypothetical protein
MEKTRTLIEKLVKNREIQLLIRQFESIHNRLMDIYQIGMIGLGLFDFGEYEKTHKEMQNKLQEIAVYFYSNRDYFPTKIEEEILKLLEGGRQEQKIYEHLKNIIEKV